MKMKNVIEPNNGYLSFAITYPLKNVCPIIKLAIKALTGGDLITPISTISMANPDRIVIANPIKPRIFISAPSFLILKQFTLFVLKIQLRLCLLQLIQ